MTREEAQERMNYLRPQIKFLDDAEKNSDAAYSAYLRTVEPMKSEAYQLSLILGGFSDYPPRAGAQGEGR